MRRSRSRGVTLAFGSALLLLVGVYTWAWGGVPAMEGDSQGYLDVAADLRAGRHDKLENRPLGYPAFLALTGSSEEPGRVLLISQLALHAAAVALMASLLRRVGASGLALTVFAVVAMSPPFVEHADFVLSETLTQLCVVTGLVGLSFWLLDGRPSWLALSALGLAVAPLVHMVDGLLWLALSGFALMACLLPRASSPMRRRTAIGAAVIAGVALLVMGGVMFRNAVEFDYVGVSPMLGTRLSHKTVRVLELLPDEYADVREILIRHRNEALLDPVTGHLGLAYIFRAVPELEAKTGLNEAELSSYLVRMNLELIKRAPMDYVDEVLRSSIWFFAPGVTDQSGFGSGALKAAFNGLRALVLVAFGLTVLLLAGPTVILGGKAWRSKARDDLAATDVWAQLLVVWLSLGAIAYCWIVSVTLTSAVYRLRIPVDLPILACAVLGPSLWRLLRESLGLSESPALKRSLPSPDARPTLP